MSSQKYISDVLCARRILVGLSKGLGHGGREDEEIDVDVEVKERGRYSKRGLLELVS